jgi:hypothetical protein
MTTRNSLIAVFALFATVSPAVADGQSRTALKQRHGEAIGEVYRTANGLTVTAYFNAQGSICKEHIESESRGTPMTDADVTPVLDDIAPEAARGTYKMGTFLNVMCLPDNNCAGVSEDYRQLAILKIGNTDRYRYVDVTYHSPACN